MTNKYKIRKVIAAFVKVARHARNYPHPEISIETLRRESVEAEIIAENILGKREYEMICEKAFKEN